jgi:hypothetical protein
VWSYLTRRPFVAAHPASSAAALASYWAAHTTGQLEFEQHHPQSCLRVRTEDLITNRWVLH